MSVVIEELREPEYQNLDNQAAADAINNKTITIPVNAKIGQIIKYAVDNGIYGRVNADAFDPTLPKEQRIAIWNIKGWVDNPSNPAEEADLSSDTAATMIADLLQYEYATPQQAQELGAMGFKTVRWVDHYGHGNQSADSIRVARDEISGLTQRQKTLLANGTITWNAFVAAVDNLKVGDPDPRLCTDGN
jgi:hypothetical protein